MRFEGRLVNRQGIWIAHTQPDQLQIRRQINRLPRHLGRDARGQHGRKGKHPRADVRESEGPDLLLMRRTQHGLQGLAQDSWCLVVVVIC